LTLLLTFAFISVTTGALLRYVLDWHWATTDKVFGAVVTHMLIAFTFASVFGLLQEFQPGAFRAAAANTLLDWPAMM
jgi:hypothetical protein